MSLALGIVRNDVALVASDGLARLAGRSVAEDFYKHIRLSDEVIVASCGLMQITAELFRECIESGAANDVDSLKGVLRRFHTGPAPDDPLESRPTAFAVWKGGSTPLGPPIISGMVVYSIAQGEPLSEWRVEDPLPGIPGILAPPYILGCWPSREVEDFVTRRINRARLGLDRLGLDGQPAKRGDTPFDELPAAEFVEAWKRVLPGIFEQAAKLHDPPILNSNVKVSVIQGEGRFSPFEPPNFRGWTGTADDMASNECGSLCESLAVGTANSQFNYTTTSYVDISGSTPTVVQSVGFTPNGGYVSVRFYAQIASTNTSASGYSLTLQRADGTQLGQEAYGTFITAGDNKFLTMAYEGVDASPGTSAQTYEALVSTNPGGTCSLIPVTLICENAKR